MKTWLNYILSLTLALSPVSALAASSPGDAGKQVSAAEADAVTPERVSRVIYDLDAFDKLINDLARAEIQVGGIAQGSNVSTGISKAVFQDVYAKFAGAIDLANDILLSDKLSETQRNEYLRDLFPALGNVVFKVLRSQGEDVVNDRDMESQVKDLGIAKMVLREFVLDVKSWFTFHPTTLDGETMAGERAWGPRSRVRRDKLSQSIIEELQRLSTEGIANIKDSELRHKAERFWVNKVVNTAGQLRQGRYTAQRITALTYLGFAIWGLMAPHVDAIGLIDGRSENSLFVSSVFYFTVWAVIAMFKASSISTTTLRMIAELKEMIIEGSVATRVKAETFFERLGKNTTGLVGMCRLNVRFNTPHLRGKQ
ncbi:MAG: hypothetical protein H6624_07940 [Bdellovibrionaceae bacterium]|nr:hypothetical protein [Bdellovibrionales bacterium]MCB9084262.1 hypothetical protein [Pseudobdellovibrionaceae bacterium]